MDSKKPLEPDFLKGYRLTTDLIKALIWPVVTVFIFLSIKTPLLLLLAGLPDVLSKSTRITLGGVSLEMRQRLSAIVPPELQDTLATLSAPALQTLLQTGNYSYRYLKADWETNDSEAPAVQELMKVSLIAVGPSADTAWPVQFQLTPLGKKAYTIVLRVLTEQLSSKPNSP